MRRATSVDGEGTASEKGRVEAPVSGVKNGFGEPVGGRKLVARWSWGDSNIARKISAASEGVTESIFARRDGWFEAMDAIGAGSS